MGIDCYILTQSSSDHSCTSFAFWLGCSTVGHWGPKTFCLPLALNLASCPQLSPTGTRTDWNSNWPKPSVAPGYIIVGVCICTKFNHVHRSRWYSNIFDQMHLFHCSSAYLHRCISWLTAQSRVNMLHYTQFQRSFQSKNQSTAAGNLKVKGICCLSLVIVPDQMLYLSHQQPMQQFYCINRVPFHWCFKNTSQITNHFSPAIQQLFNFNSSFSFSSLFQD